MVVLSSESSNVPPPLEQPPHRACGEKPNKIPGHLKKVPCRGRLEEKWRAVLSAGSPLFGLGGAGVARAWRGHGTGLACFPRGSQSDRRVGVRPGRD
eukprot:gene12941-biopygen14063